MLDGEVESGLNLLCQVDKNKNDNDSSNNSNDNASDNDNAGDGGSTECLTFKNTSPPPLLRAPV